MTTAQRWVPNDSATITAPAGTGNLAGTVTFTLYRGGCVNNEANIIYGPVDRVISGANNSVTGVTVSTDNALAVSAASGQTFTWKVAYDSTNPAQRDILASCHETSTLTIANGGTISS